MLTEYCGIAEWDQKGSKYIVTVQGELRKYCIAVTLRQQDSKYGICTALIIKHSTQCLI
jgi:hypothetical protein